jgi:hypothetical protein
MPREILNENSPLRLPPNHSRSTGPENIGPERAGFGGLGIGAVGSPAATTLEINEKSRPNERRRTGCIGRLAEERELGSKTLCLPRQAETLNATVFEVEFHRRQPNRDNHGLPLAALRRSPTQIKSSSIDILRSAWGSPATPPDGCITDHAIFIGPAHVAYCQRRHGCAQTTRLPSPGRSAGEVSRDE